MSELLVRLKDRLLGSWGDDKVVGIDSDVGTRRLPLSAFAPRVHDHVEFLTQAEIEALPGFGGSEGAVVHVRDEKSSGTHGGSFVSGSYQVRDINAEVEDAAEICSVLGNQITLDAGTYRCWIFAPAYRVRVHRVRLYDYSNDVELLLGQNAYCHEGGFSQTFAMLFGIFTLSSLAALEVQHQCSMTNATTGLGVASSIGIEYYTEGFFRRVAV